MEYKIINQLEIERSGLQEDDDYIVYNPLSESVIVVNSTAGEILLMLKKGFSLEKIISEFANKYQAEISDIENNINEYLSMMCEKGFIVKA